MEFLAKIVHCIQPLTIFAKHFTLVFSQGYEYASDKTKQNPFNNFFGEIKEIQNKLGSIILTLW